MIKNPGLFKEFENTFIMGDEKLTFDSSIKLFTYMWKEGLKLGVLPPREPLEGIEVDIRIAKTLNSCLKKSLVCYGGYNYLESRLLSHGHFVKKLWILH